MKIIKNPDKEITDELDEYFSNEVNCPCRVSMVECVCEEFKSQEEGMCICERFIKVKE